MKEIRPHKSHLIGLAGVHAVASQLALHGHNPCLPGVDYGFDLMLDSGIRIQVKASSLYMTHPAYPTGAYRFSIRENLTVKAGQQVRGRRLKRDWKNLCDYFIFWGINENRFFIMPCEFVRGNTFYIRRESPARVSNKAAARSWKKEGRSTGWIAEQLGISLKECRWLLASCPKNEKFLNYEEAWDQLDVNKTLENIASPKVTIPLEVRPLEV